jgi:hypothetical protein
VVVEVLGMGLAPNDDGGDGVNNGGELEGRVVSFVGFFAFGIEDKNVLTCGTLLVCLLPPNQAYELGPP